jgi:muconate cycloisomerase
MTATISSIEAILVDLPTIRAHQLAMATMQQQTLVIVRLRCSDGIEGIGEATTIGGLSYGDESPEGIKLTIDTYLAPALVGQDATNVHAAMARLNKVARGNRFAKSALESAMLDAQGKRLDVPLATLLGGAVRDTLPVLWTLASGDTAAISRKPSASWRNAATTRSSSRSAAAACVTTWRTSRRSSARWAIAPA